MCSSDLATRRVPSSSGGPASSSPLSFPLLPSGVLPRASRGHEGGEAMAVPTRDGRCLADAEVHASQGIMAGQAGGVKQSVGGETQGRRPVPGRQEPAQESPWAALPASAGRMQGAATQAMQRSASLRRCNAAGAPLPPQPEGTPRLLAARCVARRPRCSPLHRLLLAPCLRPEYLASQPVWVLR